MANNVEATVREYYRVVGDLSCTEREFMAIVAPDAIFTEHPNPIAPRGAVRTVEENLAGFRAGRVLLSEQTIEVLEVLISGDRAAVRAAWSGTVSPNVPARGAIPPGAELTCVMAAFLTVRDNQIVTHDTYDCYPPLPVASTV